MLAYSTFRYSHHYHINKCSWLDLFSQFDMTIHYVPGKSNVVANALSHRPDLAVVCWVSWVWFIDLDSWGLGSCLWWLMGTAQESRECLWAWFYVPWWSVVPHMRWEWSQFGDPWGCWVMARLALVVPWWPLWWASWCVSHGWCLIQMILVERTACWC